MMCVGEVVNIRGKTEQRCGAVIEALRDASGPMSYEDIRIATGGTHNSAGRVEGGVTYDILLYVVTTLLELGLVTRTKMDTRNRPGAPRVQFQWEGKSKARGLGPRSAKAA